MPRTTMKFILLALTAALLLDSCQTDEKVSFYGASYIHLSVQEAKSATDISFRFRTHLADAMLLLAAGTTDYCLIKLESGRLKVHINLGAGEKELASARELTLNDLSWHDVNLTRRDANITLKIDVIHSVSDVLPGRFFELNINYGVYIGGQGGSHELFLGHTEYLRGCMADISYNGIRVIEQVRNRRNSTEATAVSWGCSAEFDAGPNSDLSFVEDGAFTAIPRAIPRSGARWELELKTAASSGLLLFNAGQSMHADFLGIELMDGKIRLLMNKGNGPTELIHNRFVSDGFWHQVQLDFTPSFIGISIDGQSRNKSLPAGNRYLDLADTLYIGGTELNKRAKALGKGVKSGDVSYKGCLRNMLLDGKEIGLPHVKVSQGLVVNCVWGFPCAEAEPCIEGATCSQLGVRSFKCICDQTLCIKSNFTDEYKFNTNLPISLEVLSVKPISVAEGKRVALSDRNIAMILDIAKFGLNESYVILALLTPPAHGSLQLDKSTIAVKTPFTLYDVHQQKISYLHDGSETTEDSMILKVVLQANSRHSLPGYFQDSLRFTLYVNVTPVNDPPRLEIHSNSMLRLAQGTRKTLTKDVVWAVDADTPAESLVYTVLSNDSDVGYVERITLGGYAGGQAVHTFTQAELARGSIDYVHSGKNKTKAVLGLKVRDNEASSQPQYLRIVTYPLSIKLKHNTGLIVVHRSFSFITPANLSFITNAEDSRIEIRYNVIKPPVFGILQRQREPNQPWINTDHFTSRDLEQQTVRYYHNVGSPRQDGFKFQASVREVHSSAIYDFNITFIILELLEIYRNSVNFSNSVEVIIDSRKLKFQTNPLITDTSMIVYSLLEGPKYGYIYVDDERPRIGQTFTQQDIDSNRLRYRHFRRAFSTIEDWIVFKVTAPQCSDVTTSFSLRYVPAKTSDLPDNIETIHVIEGHRTLLKTTRTNYRDFGVTSLSFNLTERPQHGCLTIYNDSLPIRLNTTYFTSDELSSKSVFYVHDNSETTSDSVEFLAMSTDDADFMYIGKFYIEIKLKNDNPPIRINRRNFHVVSKAEKLITKADLLFADEDLDTKPSDLIYTVKQISNGMIVKVNEPQYPITRFTQQDIDEEKILYKHRGNKYERIDFTVSDGELFTNDELEIQAGQAYIKLLLHEGAVVQSNRSVLLTTKDIDIETNVYASSNDIIYTVLDKPKYGVILKYNTEISTFNRDDLMRNTITYKHVGVSLKKDQFKLKVNIRGAEDVGIFTMKVLPGSYWEPLIVHNNNTVYVEEATSVILNRKSLEIGHPDIPSSRITYYIREWPKQGYLEAQAHEENMDEEDDDFGTHLVKRFEQNLINDGRVYYVQSAPNQTHDKLVVDVTNGITWLHNLTVNIVIVPDKLYVAARNLTVPEGKSVILHESDFYAVTPYFAGKITDYKIVEKPKHGNVLDHKNNPIMKFTHKQLSAKEIMYKNNGDEVSMDYFKMIVIAGEKSSKIFEVWIDVQPINDELPVVVNKTNFSIWQGGSMIITKDLLAAADNDTLPIDLVFNIQNVANGYFSLSETPKVAIHNFSQEMINTLKILFTHTNGSEAEFRFTVNDGLHTTETNRVLLSTKPVAIMIERNKILNVFPLARKPITSELLLSKCTDANRDIKYFIRSGPNMGKIIMETSEGTWLKVDKFTQKDLNDSKVLYEHFKQFNNLTASDSFVFDIETHFTTPIKNQIFKIDISVSSGGLHRYVSITPVRVEEGGSAPFSMNVSEIINFLRTKAAIFNPDVFVRLIKQPIYGHVMLLPDVNLTTYSQNEVESGKMAYFHDHSDTIKDQIDFTVYFSPGHVSLCNISIPVDITPINDEPFKLHPVKAIDVVQNQTQTITRENLLTTDPDTSPEEIIYEIINAPTYGRLLLLSADQNSNMDIHQPQKFTQQDIDSSRLIYEHKGPLLLSTFYFRVSDGRFNHDYNIININVHPIKLNITVVKPISIQQGKIFTTIDTESLKLDTNVRQNLVTYEITKRPKYGVLYAREQTMSFKHTDLLSKEVVYAQQDMTASNDSFELTARVSDYEVSNIRVPIRVVPLIIMKSSLQVFAGDRTKLSKEYFDATPLAQEARSDPAYKIIRKPKFAKVMRIMNRTMSSGEKRGLQEKEITKFSHSQILSGLIYLVCKKVPSDDIHGVLDSFEFILAAPQSAPRFQPAMSIFDFRVKLNSDYYNNSLDGPMDPVGHEGEMAIAPNMSNDYTLLLGMLLGVFFLGICVIVTIRCRQSRYKQTDEEDEEEDQDKVEPSSPSAIPLPRPPDHLLPATPHLKRYANDHHNNSLSSSTPLPPMMPSLTSTLPQCKVIPLSPMENITGSEVDVSARYPYGVADADEWSSFETTDLPCPSQTSQQRTTSNPLLRRNQYWV